MHQCVDHISSALEHKSLQSIHRYVRQTHSPIDDQLVFDIQELDSTHEALRGEMENVRSMHTGQISKLKELESVRQKFKNSRFDDVRSGFVNEQLISGVLAQFLQGLISGADVWGTIKRNQRYRDRGAVPDFGSGGLGDVLGGDIGDILGTPSGRRSRKRRGSSWNIPSPRRGGGAFKLPRSSGNHGGGFKTGGGF